MSARAPDAPLLPQGLCRDERRQLVELARIASEQAGIELPPHKAPMIAARLLPRLRELGLRGFDQYLERLDEQERQVVVDRLTTHETAFFRDPEQLRHVAGLLRARAERDHGRALRAWSAACSSGEEAWTLGMILAALPGGDAATVLGTDVAVAPLSVAQRATYSLARATEIPLPYLKRHVLRGTGEELGWLRMARPLRERTRFRQHNLLHDATELGEHDVIVLRNVLMYFAAERRREVVERVARRLSGRGLLVVGRVDQIAQPGLHPLGHGVFAKGPG